MELEIIDVYSKEKKTLPLISEEYNLYNEYDKNIFFENKKYLLSIDLKTYNDIKNVNVYVGNIQVNTDYDELEQKLCSLSEYIFIDCFDLAKIKVEVIFTDETIEVLLTHNIRIAVPKATNEYIEKMLWDIENNYSNMLEVCFSKTKKQSGLSSKGDRGFESTLLLLEQIYLVFRDVYPFFQNSANNKLDNISRESSSHNVNSISSENIQWIFTHPECMKETIEYSPILFNRKHYQVEKIQASKKYESTNTYENQAILGFIDYIYEYLLELEVDICKQIEEYSKEVPEHLKQQLPSEYDFAYNCISFYYREVAKKVKKLLEVYSSLYEAYGICLGCDKKSINTIPRYTFTFRQRYHYRQCFNQMVKWFESGKYDLLTSEYLFKLKKLSKIFEYYSLLKIQSAIEMNGCGLIKSEKIEFNTKNVTPDINNYYVYTQNDNHSVKIEVYYEPYIYSDKIGNGIDLYSTGYKILDGMKRDKFWTPDFLIKISIENKAVYYILDSKFSSFDTVKKYRMSELINKYIVSIASMNQYHSQVLGLWAIYPSVQSNSLNLKKNYVNSQKESLPIMEICSLEIEENSMVNLIRKMVDIAKDYLSIT